MAGAERGPGRGGEAQGSGRWVVQGLAGESLCLSTCSLCGSTCPLTYLVTVKASGLHIHSCPGRGAGDVLEGDICQGLWTCEVVIQL